MGRNGAGKSTLLRTAAGLIEPARGGCAGAGRLRAAAAEPRRPAGARASRRRAPRRGRAGGSGGGRARVGRRRGPARSLRRRARAPGAGDRDGRPRGRAACPGWSASTSPPGGWTPPASSSSASWLRELAADGAAVVVATHDVEFAARLCRRVVLLGDGELIADGPADEILAGGWYFATEVARILGAHGALTPEQGASCCAPRSPRPGWWRRRELAGRHLRRADARPRRRLLVVRALPPERPAGRAGRRARRARRRGPAGPRPGPEPGGDDGHRAAHRLRARRRPGVRGRGAGGPDLEHLARPGTVDRVADGGLGAGRPRRCLAGDDHPPPARPARPGDRVRRSRASPTAPCSTSR